MSLLARGCRLLHSASRITAQRRVLTSSYRTTVPKVYKQPGIVILPKQFADDFEQFCSLNSGPLPLLYKGQPGEWRCSDMLGKVDIRTSFPQYYKYEAGNLCASLPDLLPHTGDLEEMVVFILGYSPSGDMTLQTADNSSQNVNQSHTLSIYKTTVPCQEVSPFQCNLLVSMRPVPEKELSTTVQMEDRHGAPVHIGYPGLLGIKDLSKPDYGAAVELQQGVIPVFRACGATAVEAVKSCKAPLAFTHTPGSVYISEAQDSQLGQFCGPPDSIQSVCISENPLHFSLASSAAVQKIRSLEGVIITDPGNRGIRALFVQDELLKASLSMSHAKSVLITTGFPTHFNQNPPEETDGPPGALAMAAMLQALRKEVAIVVDLRALEMFQAIIAEALKQGILKQPVPILSFQEAGQDAAKRFLCHNGDPQSPRYDHLVAVERAGRARDGSYYNMRKVNIKHLVDSIDDLFIAASTIPGITTTGIGDGGNELGMGKVKEAVRKCMPNGDLIACDVAADHAIACGVSNWGGYAVACALYILNCCLVHERYLRKAVGLPRLSEKPFWTEALPVVSKEEQMMHILVKFGIRSGKTGTLGMEVDGLPFYSIHSDIIQQLRDITL
ncbi:D-glutamate cyclase, mitochondrial-like [Erpetoichthys calabaricus]|uniref:D-glutamate cyclase n=1 Tax=Erpetoichthys calabaricus TaxID=27687 RepID=A0A8C4SXZ3_ERPCA|nr:D-glutamate cyclase, mitochondrial-like [Erpetoichthys calabaricus]XP_028677462.1 D-glutamate cyclase, mitochondrial-like [Erpetoichthys calabaricus]XP_028677464.1 D-glutamate cyclase, mitochondrial-like [Erpetoichthys calabaricus]XP_051775731.1 D-glutamate cyclase, mitochondrial-like [Erpetoichthys calabaricus]XP_051775733.1 D-glutamate cyclase, mitochondrial-like [Erpetoichthys calabaricus]